MGRPRTTMNTSGFDADKAAAIQRTVKKIKQISTWAVAALTVVGAVFAYWSVTSEEEDLARAKRTMKANDNDDSDDGGDEGGGAPATVETASSKTEEATAVEAATVVPVQAVNTPGANDTPEPEGPGEWVTELLGLKDDEFGPDVNDSNEMQETQAMIMMNQLAALQEVLTGTKKQELTQLVETVQANQGNQQVFQMLQNFAAGAQQELSAGEQEKCQQVFFNLQLQRAQAKLQQKILEKTKALIFAALPAELQGAGQTLQERLSVVEAECHKLEKAGEAEKSHNTANEFSVQYFEDLANLEAAVTGADKVKLQQDKNLTVYRENMKLARFQYESDLNQTKQEKLGKMTQENGALMMFMIEKQQAMMMEQDPQTQMELQMTLPQELEAEVCKKPKRKAKFLKWYAEVRTERATFWRDRMLEQQIAYERNELRVQLMDAQQRKALRTKQVEQQFKLMQGQLNTMTEAEMNKELEADLAADVKQDLEDKCLRRKRELEAKFLPASERGNTEARDITDKTNQLMSEYSAPFVELKNDPEALKQEHAKMITELAQLTSGPD